MFMLNRDTYLNQLLAFSDQPEIIKVITGIRRCGKSTLLALYAEHLLSEGVPEERIIRMNFESLDFDNIRTYQQLNDYIVVRLSSEGLNHLLLDEVQQVNGWEKAVNSLRLKGNVDIVVTGSNAHMLSSELSTLLSGRYVEIRMLTLSFKEFLTFNKVGDHENKDRWLARYMEVGGFPGLTPLMNKPETIEPFLTGILNTILMKDVIQRNAVRDAVLLENVLRFIVSSVGSPISTKKVNDYLTSAGRRTTSETIDSYLSMLEDAYILYKANRYDIKGKELLKTNDKFYLSDLGLRTVLLGQRQGDFGHLLENVVYFELLRRGYQVEIGKFNAFEIDFVAKKSDECVYYQVTASLLSEETKERELRPLQSIPDFNQRAVISADHSPINDFNGIKNLNIVDFLLSN